MLVEKWNGLRGDALKKLIIGITISAVFIALILNRFDKNELLNLLNKADYFYLIPAIFIQILGVLLFAVRWYLLLEKSLNMKHSISCSFIGGAANMVLPARGGDLFRLFYCKSEAGLQYFNLLSKLFIEKVIDFVYVILLGMGAFSFLSIKNSDTGSIAIFTFSGIVVLGIIISLYLLRFQNELLDKMLVWFFSKINKLKLYQEHIQAHIIDLKDFLTIKQLTKPLTTTVIMWIMYTGVYYFSAKVIGIELTFIEANLIIFFGAISLAVPSAPSGVGVFHASIISAFIVLGRTSAEGLIFATATHLISFFVFTIIGLVFYLYWMYRRRNGKPLHFEDIEKEVLQ